MHRMLWVVAVATLVAIGSVASADAATHTKHAAKGAHAQAMSASCPLSNPALCGGSCPLTAAATATNAATTVHQMNGVVCPVSDPSKCPASCRPAGAVAVAVPARH